MYPLFSFTLVLRIGGNRLHMLLLGQKTPAATVAESTLVSILRREGGRFPLHSLPVLFYNRNIQYKTIKYDVEYN